MKLKTIIIILLSVVIVILLFINISTLDTKKLIIDDNTAINVCRQDLLYCQASCVSVTDTNEIIDFTNDLVDAVNECYNSDIEKVPMLVEIK